MKDWIKECNKNIYYNSSTLKQLISSDAGKLLTSNFEYKRIKVNNYLTYKNCFISSQDILLYNLNYFIGFFINHFIINDMEKRMILELVLESKYRKIFCENKFIHEIEYSDYVILQFKKITIDQFYKNILYFKEYFYYILEENDLENFDIENENDINKLFFILRDIINCNRNNIHWLFYNLELINDPYYLLMWKDIINTYENRKDYLKYIGL